MICHKHKRAMTKRILVVLILVSVGAIVSYHSQPPEIVFNKASQYPAHIPSNKMVHIPRSEVKAKEGHARLSNMAQIESPAEPRVVDDGENIKVGENTEVHVLSAIRRTDFPVEDAAFNAVLLTWTGGRKTDRTDFVCCLSRTPAFREVTQTPAILTFRSTTLLDTDMKYVLYSCSISTTVSSSTAKDFLYVAFAENTCNVNMTKEAHAITQPRDGRNKLAVCKSLAYGNLDPQQLVEWFEFAKLVGVSAVQVHYNRLNETALTVLRHYQKEGFLILAPVTLAARKGYPVRSFYPRDHQECMDKRVIMNDCLHRLSGFDYVAVMDFDELFMPRPPFKTLLEVLQNTRKRHPTAGVFLAHAYQNFLDWPDSDPDNAISYTRRLERTRNEFIDRVRGHRSSPKVVYMPDKMVAVETHNVAAMRKPYEVVSLPRESYSFIHFRMCKRAVWKTCDFQYFRDPEMLRFRLQWLQAISRVPLLELNLPQEYQQNITRELDRLSGWDLDLSLTALSLLLKGTGD